MPGYFVDTNVWIAYYFKGHPHNAIAAEFMRRRSVKEPASLTRAAEQSFLRLLTNAALCRGYDSPVISNPMAVDILEEWRDQPHIRCLDAEPEGTRELWLKLAAVLAAAMELGCTKLYTEDLNHGQAYESVHVINPFV